MRRERRLSTVGSVLIALAFIGFGLVLLSGNMLSLDMLAMLNPFWPWLLLVISAGFFAAMVAGGPKAGGLAIPGGLLGMLGLTMLAQNILGNWASWAYSWSIFVFGGIGIGMLINSWWSGRLELKRGGYIMLALGVVFFVAFGGFFERLFNGGAITDAANFLPLMLIGVGALILIGRLINLDGVIAKLPPRGLRRGLSDVEVL